MKSVGLGSCDVTLHPSPFTLHPSPFTHSRHHDLIVSALDDVRRQSSRRGLRSKRGVVLLNNNSFKGVCPGGPLCRGTILPDRALTLNLKIPCNVHGH